MPMHLRQKKAGQASLQQLCNTRSYVLTRSCMTDPIDSASGMGALVVGVFDDALLPPVRKGRHIGVLILAAAAPPALAAAAAGAARGGGGGGHHRDDAAAMRRRFGRQGRRPLSLPPVSTGIGCVTAAGQHLRTGGGSNLQIPNQRVIVIVLASACTPHAQQIIDVYLLLAPS